VFAFGDAPFHGAGAPAPVVAMVPVLGGYGLLSADGSVTSYGVAVDLGTSPLVLGPTGVAAAGGPLAVGVGASMALGMIEPPLLPVPPPPEPGNEVVYLTYDDGPDPTWTPQILDLLAAHGAKATFCQVGSYVERHQDLAARTVAEGHGLCNHTWAHDRLTRMDEAQYHDDIGRTAGVQVLAAGGRARCVRPPYGSVNRQVRDWIASSGMSLADWTIDTNDWKRPGTHAIANEVLAKVRGGSVILMHDGGDRRTQTVAATDIVLHRLRLAGYRFEPLPPCGPLVTEPPTVPTTTTTTLPPP
jgi:peptidoglycan-N-acetylglucosamine deacetylase